jgi:DNA (cytosine-5)-methyltransferase 1
VRGSRPECRRAVRRALEGGLSVGRVLSLDALVRLAARQPGAVALGRRTIGSLFSGIGGLELGLERAGVGRVVWQVEQDPFCRVVLARHWPSADRSVTDVREASAANLRRVDVICAGPPCQDVSVAGDGAGLDGERSGLWWEAHRIICECRPRAAIIENVAHGRSRYLCAVRESLHKLGYRTTALLVSAFETGSPHLRDRCFVVAHADREPVRQRAEREPRRWARRLQGTRQAEPGHARAERWGADQSGLGGSSHGLPGWLDGHRWPAPKGQRQAAWEPAFACTPGPHHRARLKAIGNAVAPLCAETAGRWLMAHWAFPAGAGTALHLDALARLAAAARVARLG